MNIFGKLFTALKGGATKIGEEIVDANAIRILEQEIKDSKNALQQAKESEISLLANQKLSMSKAEQLYNQITKYESNAATALKQDNELLALEIANQIISLEEERCALIDQATHFAKSAQTLGSQIQSTEAEITDLLRQLEQVKATESVQKAQENIHENLLSGKSSVASAKDSLERIRSKQDYFEARLEAATELDSASSLDKKLSAAGITPNTTSAQSILDKIKARSE